MLFKLLLLAVSIPQVFSQCTSCLIDLINLSQFYFVGLIQGICEILYDSGVVSEDGFEIWVNSDDPSERDGKAVALKSLTSFLAWLMPADTESD